MIELTNVASQLKRLTTSPGCPPAGIDQTETTYDPLSKEHQDFLLWSNGIEFETYHLAEGLVE